MGAWGKDQKAGDKVMMLGDGNAEFTNAMGLTMDGYEVRHGRAQPALCHGRATTA